MKLSAFAVGALVLGCASTAAAIEAAVPAAVPVVAQWTDASRLLDQTGHIQPIREIDWRAGHPRGGYRIPEHKPAHPWPAVEPDFRDIELPRGIELPAHLRGPAHFPGPGHDPEDDVVRCMAFGCEKS